MINGAKALDEPSALAPKLFDLCDLGLVELAIGDSPSRTAEGEGRHITVRIRLPNGVRRARNDGANRMQRVLAPGYEKALIV